MPNTDINISLRSEQIQELLTAVPHWMIRWGNTLILAIIVGLLAMSWLFKYPDVIATQALITSEVPPVKKFAKTSGKLQAILVEDNQSVPAHTPLAVIENTANYEDVFFLKSVLDTLPINQKDFQFPMEQMPILFLGEIDSDYALFENNYIQYQLQKQLQPFSGETQAHNISRRELESRIRILQSQKNLNHSELMFQKTDLDRMQQLYEKGVISQQEFEKKQQGYYQAERSYINIDATISQLREALSNTRRNATNTTINKTKEEVALLKNVLQSFNQLKTAIKNWEMRYVLSAEIDGRVSFLNVWNKNQTVNQGELVFTIIPEQHAAFVAKLRCPAMNSGKTAVGQRVSIKLENFPDAEFGVLEGQISKISVVPDEEGMYLIDVDLPEKLITNYEKEIPFKYEMLGSAEIITEDLRLIERFFYQLKDVFSKGS